ncbi:hypothetical protein Tco_1531409 [Tanacetum coccineum]
MTSEKIVHLPQQSANNNNSYRATTINSTWSILQASMGFNNEVKDTIVFQDNCLLQPWQTFMQIFAKCLTTLSPDRPTAVADNAKCCWLFQYIHVYYASYYARTLLFDSSSNILIPYPRLQRALSVLHDYLPEFSNMLGDINHLGGSLMNEATEHYRMYAEVFGIDVPLTQSQPTESTHGTHRITSAPRSPNPDKEAAESSAPR